MTNYHLAGHLFCIYIGINVGKTYFRNAILAYVFFLFCIVDIVSFVADAF